MTRTLPIEIESLAYLANKCSSVNAILAEYLLPDSELTATETISKLIGLMDNEESVKEYDAANEILEAFNIK